MSSIPFNVLLNILRMIVNRSCPVRPVPQRPGRTGARQEGSAEEGRTSFECISDLEGMTSSPLFVLPIEMGSRKRVAEVPRSDPMLSASGEKRGSAQKTHSACRRK